MKLFGAGALSTFSGFRVALIRLYDLGEVTGAWVDAGGSGVASEWFRGWVFRRPKQSDIVRLCNGRRGERSSQISCAVEAAVERNEVLRYCAQLKWRLGLSKKPDIVRS